MSIVPHCKTIIDELSNRGYRITPQREMIINAISHSSDHLSAEEIFAQVQKLTQATNIATVYRTLDMLWEEGFANKNDLGEGKVVYAARQHGSHIHLVCRICDQVFDSDPQILISLGEILHSHDNFIADLDHLSIFGVCADCQKITE
jgi:Fur family ferric uptake transcriptional regulator